MGKKWYKCLECGDVFPTKTPHTHGNQYRKRRIPWEEVEMPKSYAALEAEVERLKERIKYSLDYQSAVCRDCEDREDCIESGCENWIYGRILRGEPAKLCARCGDYHENKGDYCDFCTEEKRKDEEIEYAEDVKLVSCRNCQHSTWHPETGEISCLKKLNCLQMHPHDPNIAYEPIDLDVWLLRNAISEGRL